MNAYHSATKRVSLSRTFANLSDTVMITLQKIDDQGIEKKKKKKKKKKPKF